MEPTDLAAVRSLAASPLARRPVRTIASAIVLAAIVVGLLLAAVWYARDRADFAARWQRGQLTDEEIRNLP